MREKQKTETDPGVLNERTASDDVRDPAQMLSKRASDWCDEHEVAQSELAKQLCPEGAASAEKLLCELAAHDFLLLKEMGRPELVLTKQINMLVAAGLSKNLPGLTRSLKDLSSVRNEAGARFTELMKAAECLAARRRLESDVHRDRKHHLRRVG